MDALIRKIVEEVVEAAFEISSGLRCGRSYVQHENPSQEQQLQADLRANDLLKRTLARIDGVGEFASEEEERVLDCGDGLSVTVDPLDGSSNLPTNNIVGTIVGVFDHSLPAAGRQLVAAFYVVYGPITTIMVARNGQVHEYALEEEEDSPDVSFHRTRENLRLPAPSIYGFGGREDQYSDSFHAFADEIRSELKLRYGGSLVGDANQVLHRGGIYAYPGLKNRPEGKLRLLYEASPMSYIFEQAGGASSDGNRSIREIEPSGLHQQTPLFIGNRELIDRAEEKLA